VSGSVSVAEADVLTGHPVSFTAHAHQAFSGTVATFDDTFTANVPGDFVATIDWGDGTTTAGTVSGGSGSFTVSGAHTYISPGQDTVTVLLADDAPGTATATASSVVNVAARSAKNDFNGDRTSDLLFQETGGSDGGGHLTGTPQIWLMNNTSVTAQVTLPNPGATWSIVGTGDFNNDGDDDILFNDAATGNVQIWEMNGTSVASMIPLPFPGANWVPLGIGDFNGDGTADILWRNSVSGEVDTWFINNGHMVGGTGAGFAGSQWQMVGLGDFNGDGTTDVLWRNKNTGAVESWMIHNGLLVGGGGVGTASSAWVPAGTGDFNGDGTTDVLWRNTNTGEVDDWLMTNGHISGGTAFGFAPAGTTVVGTGDYNADGKADILLQAADGTPTIWTSNGSAVTATTSFPTPGQNWRLNAG
jgi:hypothetical protein